MYTKQQSETGKKRQPLEYDEKTIKKQRTANILFSIMNKNKTLYRDTINENGLHGSTLAKQGYDFSKKSPRYESMRLLALAAYVTPKQFHFNKLADAAISNDPEAMITIIIDQLKNEESVYAAFLIERIKIFLQEPLILDVYTCAEWEKLLNYGLSNNIYQEFMQHINLHKKLEYFWPRYRLFNLYIQELRHSGYIFPNELLMIISILGTQVSTEKQIIPKKPVISQMNNYPPFNPIQHPESIVANNHAVFNYQYPASFRTVTNNIQQPSMPGKWIIPFGFYSQSANNQAGTQNQPLTQFQNARYITQSTTGLTTHGFYSNRGTVASHGTSTTNNLTPTSYRAQRGISLQWHNF